MAGTLMENSVQQWEFQTKFDKICNAFWNRLASHEEVLTLPADAETLASSWCVSLPFWAESQDRRGFHQPSTTWGDSLQIGSPTGRFGGFGG
ncbi:Hypothetical predicted protein [Pelobates cultripes]|uniref:Uncharacterized protein n=1 Tax=Pelobates cultripes TaxID=61616 RepID=A0AAD1T4E8_PELCU|nr:Hypothetical predicted protein [Pelobates cultripes]